MMYVHPSEATVVATKASSVACSLKLSNIDPGLYLDG